MGGCIFSSSTGGGGETLIFENYKALGWEEVEVEAGKLRALKMEYKREWDSPATVGRKGRCGTGIRPR